MSEQPYTLVTPTIPWEAVKALSKMGFSSTEKLIVLLCLSELDSADCLKIDVAEISLRLAISTRTVHYAIEKFRNFGVKKDINDRYLFTELIAIITDLCSEQGENNGI
jgi:hypothetical protein